MKLKLFYSSVAILCATTSVAQIKLTAGGSIGIGTENPVHPLHINMPRLNISQSNAPFRIEVANSDPRLTSTSKVVFYNTSHTGHISVEASSFNTMSDERLKTNIAKLSGSGETSSALQKVLKLNGYTYQLKKEVAEVGRSRTGASFQTGFLAQELEQVVPEVVSTGNDSTQMKSVAYHQIIPYLVEAIKEQQVIIDELKGRLQQVEVKGLVRKENEIISGVSPTKKEN